MSERIEALIPIVFFSTAALLVVLERFAALTRQPVGVGRRTVGNLGLFAVGTIAAAVLIPAGVYAFAAGLPPGLVSGSGLPAAAQWLVTFLVLDLWHYGLHRLFHRISPLWRLHLVHHSDTRIDVTTTERHHPIDLLLSTALLMALIAALGLPAPGVGLYLLVATVVALTAHANLRLPDRVDRVLRRWVVTPSAHAIHHSACQPQTDSNFGMVLTVWDRLFGTWRDPAGESVERFGLAYFRAPRHAGLGGVLAQPFVYRRNEPADAESSDENDDPATPHSTAARRNLPVPAAWQRALLFGGIGVATVSLAMASTWIDMAASWTRNEAYLWCWLVLPVVVYRLAWHVRAATLAVTPQPDLSGIWPCLLAAVVWWLADLMNVNAGRELALVLALHGVALAMLGWRAYRVFFSTLALLFLMVPSADVLQPVLRAITVDAIELFARAANLPHHIDGYTVLIGARRYVVVDACSGLAYVTLAMFLGYSFGLLLYHSFWKVAALAAFGAALGVVCNLVRVTAIVAVDWIRGTQMDLAAHGDVQWVALFATLALLLAALSRLPGDEPPPAPGAPTADRSTTAGPSTAGRLRWTAPAVAGASVLLTVLVGNAVLAPAIAFSRAADATALRRHADPPAWLAGWSRVPDAAVWVVDPDGLTESLRLAYRQDDRALQVTVVETLSPAVKLPAWQPPREPGVNWHEVRTRRESVCVDGICTSFRQFSLSREKTRQRREVYAAYCIGALVTDSTVALRARHAWHRLSGRQVDRRSVAFAYDGDAPEPREVALAMRQLHESFEAASP